MIRLSRLPFVLLAMTGLVLGLWTGLNRIGWNWGVSPLTMHHGAVMVGGFLGTLISLEKIIPLQRKSLYAIPTLSALSVGVFFLGNPSLSFALLITAASGLVGVFMYYLVREKNIIYLLMVAGSICWLTGNVLLLTRAFYPMAFPWWLGFGLLIITAERIELMKFLPVSKTSKQWLVLLLGLYVVGILLSFHGIGRSVSGISLVAVAVWLLRHDIIPVSIRKKGLPRFVAIALLCGYLAMMFTGAFFIALNQQPMSYDAIVHTFFLGFVFSMIFAHGPIILPGVMGMTVKPWHPLLYGWLILLHTSWIIRIAADVLLLFDIRKISGIISTVAILGYFATLATITFHNKQRHAKVL